MLLRSISVEMVDAKITIVSVVAVLSVFLQHGIRAQPTISSSSEDDSCSQLEEESEFQDVENARLRSLLESERQTTKTQENVSYSQAEEIQRLNLELGNKQQLIATLRNASNNQTKDNHRLNLELENKQQMIDTLVTVSNSTAEEICRLNLELAERRRLRTRELQSVKATFSNSFDAFKVHPGITKVEDKIYVLNYHPNMITVYEGEIGFRFIKNITLSGMSTPYDIVYSNRSKCVYINDPNQKYIWVMTTIGEHRLTKWLTSVYVTGSLSLSNDGHLLLLNRNESLSQDSLEIYSLNATLIRRLQLPQDIIGPLHLVQTSAGNFIILHQLNTMYTGPWRISQLTNDGQLIHRFIPRNQSEVLNEPYHLSLDADNNRLFVADYGNYRVILFDSIDLTWNQVLVSQENYFPPWKVFYDASKKYLYVGQYRGRVKAYKIS